MTSTEYQQLMEALGRQSTEMVRRFTETDRRFTETDRQLAEISGQLGEMRRDLLGHFDDIYRRFERLEQEYQAITQALRRIEAGFADERGRREILERDLAELKQRLLTLQSRIEDIEQRLNR